MIQQNNTILMLLLYMARIVISDRVKSLDSRFVLLYSLTGLNYSDLNSVNHLHIIRIKL